MARIRMSSPGAAARSLTLAAALGLPVAVPALAAGATAPSVTPTQTTAHCLQINLAGFEVACYGQAVYGEPIALTFTVTNASGPLTGNGLAVVLIDDQPVLPVPVTQGKGRHTVDNLPALTGLQPGAHTLGIRYLGDAANGPSTSAPFPMTVIPALATVYTWVTPQGGTEVTIPKGTALPITTQVVQPGVLPASGTIALTDLRTGQPFGRPFALDATGQVTQTVTFSTPGTYALCSTFGGDARYEAVHCFQGHGVIDPWAPGVRITVTP